MPRKARTFSGSNIYHVMLRGINKQNIFEEDEDRFYFMKTLDVCKEISGFRLHAFVLMSNHIHLLIEPADESLDMIFRRIGTRYAVWYNRKYQRAGHLFQDRFRSENVETDLYFMTVLRYILQNPMKAGLEKAPGSYPWSSYRAYALGKSAVTDMQFAVDLFGNREVLLEYIGQNNDDVVMDDDDFDWRLHDQPAKEIMLKLTQCSSVSDFQRLDPSVQKKYAWELYRNGLSLGQIARFTGLSKSTVHYTVQKHRKQAGEEEETTMLEPDSMVYCADIIW